jgi:outer membrane receptor protein involved in Fe transport
MIWDHNFILSGDYDINEDIDVTFNAGATSRSVTYDRQGVSSSGQLVFDVLRHNNFELQDEIQFTTYQNIVGLYGQAEFGYKDYLFVTVNARNDWASNMPEDNNSLFYKGASAAFLPTTAIEGLRSETVNFLKFRVGYGESAGFAQGFPTSVNINANAQAFLNSGQNVAINTTDNFLANPNLRPELYSEVEVGVESRFFDNRLSF